MEDRCGLHDKRFFQTRSSVIGTAAVVNALNCIASFCPESVDINVLDMITTACNLVSSEECSEEIGSVLLNSVVSSIGNVIT